MDPTSKGRIGRRKGKKKGRKRKTEEGKER